MKLKLLRLFSGAALLAALATAMGCGAGGSESPPSKQAFIRKANLSCDESVKEKERVAAEGVAIRRSLHGHLTNKAIEQYSSSMMEVYEGEAERLAELTPPAGDQKKIDALVKAMHEGAERYRVNPEGGGVPFTKASRMAEAYGLDKCVW